MTKTALGTQAKQDKDIGNFLRVGDVAELLGCHRQSVYRAILRKKHRLPHYKIEGVGVRFKREDIERFIQDSRR